MDVRAWWIGVLGVGVIASCGGAAGVGTTAPAPVPAGLSRGDLPECALAPGGGAVATHTAAPDDVGRTAAQRGLSFLASDTVVWQQQHNCYGCHVQAVTLDAMIVGRRNNYDVDEAAFREVLRGMLDIPGGARGPVGFSVQDDPTHLIETSKSFGGAALAEYDEHVSPELQEELIRAAEFLLGYQEADGSVRSTDHRPPVVAGLMQSTTQAARTWRQAYARTADDRWLLPIANAEAFIRTRATQLTDEDQTYLQDLSYAIIGLLAAGATPTEEVVRLLEGALRARQSQDGSWSFQPGAPASAFATGQALYVLKRLGAAGSDDAVSRATGWLVEMQQEDGSWSTGGDRRGEAMWAVMGLVSIDVLSVTVTGTSDGSHVTSALPFRARAVDAAGEPAASIELRVDDVPVHRACGGELSFSIDPSALESGAHQLDLVAVDRSGKTSRRRLTIYTGDHYLTRVGSRFVDGSTRFSLRNVAPASQRGRVRLSIYRAGERDGQPARGERLHTDTLAATEGPMSFAWRSDAARGRYLAELAYLDEEGHVKQTVEVPFVHDTEEAQQQQFGQVAGRIDFDEADVAGAEVELVDGRGNVVQRARTTRSGQYRFRNVDRGEYRVRVRRRGFRDAEAPVQAAPASSVDANMSLHMH